MAAFFGAALGRNTQSNGEPNHLRFVSWRTFICPLPPIDQRFNGSEAAHCKPAQSTASHAHRKAPRATRQSRTRDDIDFHCAPAQFDLIHRVRPRLPYRLAGLDVLPCSTTDFADTARQQRFSSARGKVEDLPSTPGSAPPTSNADRQGARGFPKANFLLKWLTSLSRGTGRGVSPDPPDAIEGIPKSPPPQQITMPSKEYSGIDVTPEYRNWPRKFQEWRNNKCRLYGARCQ